MTAHVHSIDPKVYARRWTTLGVLSLGLLIIGLDNTILNVALPSLQDQLGAEGSTLQWIVDSYLLVFAGLVLTFGAFGDRFGRKRGLQAGTAIFGLASLCVVFVGSAGQLIGVRALMGVGAALIMPATLSIISNVFPREERAKAIAVWSATAALGIGLGPLAGGLLLEWFDWQAVFLVNVPVAALAFFLGLRFVPESRDPHPGSFDLAGAALSIVALVTFVYGIIEAPGRGWLDPVTLGCFGAAALVAVAFVAWELRAREPMLDLSYFREPRFGVASVAISLAFFSLFGAAFATTLYLQFAHGYSALQAGAAMSPLALGLIIGAGSGAKLSARLGTTKVVAAGLAGLGLLQLATLAWTPGPRLLAARPLVLRPRTEHRLDHGPGDRLGHGRGLRREGRRCLGNERRDPAGRRRPGRRRRRLARHLALQLPRRGCNRCPAAGSAQAASDSVGGAVAVAEQIPGDAGASLAHAATVAYTDALGLGLLAGAAASFVGVALVLRFLPARHRPAKTARVVSVTAVESMAA